MDATLDNLTAAVNEPDILARIVEALEGDNIDFGRLQLLTREAITGEARAMLGRDQQGWGKFGQDAGEYDFDKEYRDEVIKSCRAGAKTNPVLRQAHRLWVNFSIGGGITVNTDISNKQVAEFLPRFWGDPKNSEVLSPKGQCNSAFRLLTDGDLFFVLVKMPGKQVPLVRRIQATEIFAIVTNEDDRDDILGYVRKFTPEGPDKTEKVYFYPHWTHEELTKTPPEVANYPGCKVEGTQFQAGKFIHHVAFEPLGRWGNPLAGSVMGLTQAHLRFIQSRLTIIQAIASFVRKLIVKGGPDVVAALKSQFQSSLAASNGLQRESNPGPAAGSTLIGNADAKFDNMKLDTGSESAQTDGMMLITVIGTGLGIFPHYFGQGESFRLATATAMEPPMMRMFLAFQKLWEQTYEEITKQALAWQGVPLKKRYVRMDFPEISPRNMSALMESMALMFKAAPGFLQIPDVGKIILALIGVDNPQAVVELMKKENLDLRPAAERAPLGTGSGSGSGDEDKVEDKGKKTTSEQDTEDES